MLTIGDLERMAELLSVADFDAWLLANFLASPGAKLRIRGTGEMVDVPTIVPRRTETGCVFLQHHRCQVHAAAPFGCSHVDMHMTNMEGQLRSIAAHVPIYNDHLRNGPYNQAWQKLFSNGRRATPPQRRLSELSVAIQEIERKQRKRKR